MIFIKWVILHIHENIWVLINLEHEHFEKILITKLKTKKLVMYWPIMSKATLQSNQDQVSPPLVTLSLIFILVIAVYVGHISTPR